MGNGCEGETIDCGSCDSGYTCTNNKCVATCTTQKTCAADYIGKCGTFSDGCGGQITCTCSGTDTCVDNECRPPCLGLGETCGASPADANDKRCCSNNCGFFKEYPDSSESRIAWNGQVTSVICCPAGTILGPKDRCFTTGNVNNETSFAVYVNATGNPNDFHAAPTEKGWADCDVSQLLTTGPCKNVCHGGWVASGEANVGEYSNTGNAGCCGDDQNENLIYGGRVLAPASIKCCNKASDCVDENGNCVALGATNSQGKVCSECGWLQENMDGTETGCCSGYNQCLVDKAGDPEKDWLDWYQVDWDNGAAEPDDGPNCINQGQFILDKRCFGNPSSWVSRTSRITYIMLNRSKAEGDDYVLFCDTYTNSLNYYKQVIDGSVVDQAFLNKNGECGIYPCFGDYFCVLLDKTGQIRAVGGTLNPDFKDFDNSSHNFEMLYSVLNITGASCDTLGNNFKDCGKGLSYNPGMSAFIYTRKEAGSESPGIIGAILQSFRNLFDSLFGRYIAIDVEDMDGLEKIYKYRYPDFSRFYAMRQGNREILGMIESYNNSDRLMINYTGFSTDICAATRGIVAASGARCAQLGGSYYIVANRTMQRVTPIFDNWANLTASLRVNPITCPPYAYPYCPGGDVVSGVDENGCPILICHLPEE